MVGLADIVRTSTAALAERIAPLARQVQIVANALDERIWLARRENRPAPTGPVRILCMGTATHDADFALIQPALTEMHERFGEQIQVDLIGVVTGGWSYPIGSGASAPPSHAARSYSRLRPLDHAGAGPWDIGLAPLADSRFNACKSAIKLLDYAALGSGHGGLRTWPLTEDRRVRCALAANTTPAWHEALSWLIRDAAARRRLATEGMRHLLRRRNARRPRPPRPNLDWSPGPEAAPHRLIICLRHQPRFRWQRGDHKDTKTHFELACASSPIVVAADCRGD